MRAHLVAAERASGRRMERLHRECPTGLEYIWSWFVSLHRRRQSGFSVQPISFAELEAWSRLTGFRPTHEEALIIMRIDDAFMESRSG